MLKYINFENKNLFISRLPYLFLSLSLLLFSIFILKANQNPLDLSKLGLFSTTDYLFFSSFYLLILSFLITFYYDTARKSMLLPFQTIFLITMLFLLPSILEGTPRFNSVYVIGGEVEYVLRNNFINPSSIRYHNWPLAHIFAVTILHLTNIDLLKLLLIYPFISQIIFFFLLFSIFNILLSSAYKWLACFVFFLMNWFNQDYFSPQNYAYILYLLFITVLLKYLFSRSDNKFNKPYLAYKLIIIILLIALPLSHVLTTFVVILILSLMLLYFYLCKNKKIAYSLFNYNIIAAVIFISWLLFGAEFMFTRILNMYVESFGLDSARDATLRLATSGSLDHSIVVFVRSVSAALFFALAFINHLFTYFIKKDFDSKNNITSILILASLALIVAGRYGGEIIIRILLFSLIPFTYYSVKNTNISFFKSLLIIFIMLSPFFHIIGHYGSETIDYISPDELSGADFFFKHALNDSLIICPESNLCDIKYIEQFKRIYSPKLDFDTEPYYVWLTRRGESKYSFFENNESRSSYLLFKEKSNDFNKIYSNRNIQIMWANY